MSKTDRPGTNAKTKPMSATLRAPASTSIAHEPNATENVPLQIRIPKLEARRIKVAAAERDQTISQFLLTCVNAYLK